MRIELDEDEIEILLRALKSLQSDDGLDSFEWDLYHKISKALKDME